MGTIKDRNGMYLTEVEGIKKSWKKQWQNEGENRRASQRRTKDL